MSSKNATPLADQQFLDKQMTGVIESALTHGYSLANNGVIPTQLQLAAYIAQLDDTTLVDKVRAHPAAAATPARAASDSDLLRWVHLLANRHSA